MARRPGSGGFGLSQCRTATRCAQTSSRRRSRLSCGSMSRGGSSRNAGSGCRTISRSASGPRRSSTKRTRTSSSRMRSDGGNRSWWSEGPVRYAPLEKASFDREAGRPPMLPVWLSPVQVRLIPVSADYLAHCEKLLGQFPNMRVDLDDTSETLNKMVRRAEKEWIPYVAVVGRKEVESNGLNIRVRATKEQVPMSPAELRERVAGETAGRPFRSLPLPNRLSRRPAFRG